MIFRRNYVKPPLEYAISFIEIAGETARHYLHDKDYLPSPEEMAQLKKLKKTMGVQHSALGYIIRMLEERLATPDPSLSDDPPDDWYDK